MSQTPEPQNVRAGEATEPVPPGAEAPAPAGDAAPDALEVHLSPQLQARNSLIYATLVSLIYLAAPVLYVGFVQAALCERLEASKMVSNLPTTAYLGLAAFPILIAWLVPQVKWLKLTLCVSYAVIAALGAMVTAVLLLDTPNWLRITALVAHGAILGCANGVVWTFNWEALGRGVSEARRGRAFTLAYGIGPVFAVIGSLGSQLLLTNKLFGWHPTWWWEIAYPYNFALLFGASVPIMALAAILSYLYVIPLPRQEAERRPFGETVFGGLGQFFSYRLILIACIAYLLIYSGHSVQNNMSLFSKEAVDVPAEQLVGYQNALRFACKVLAGFLLGWILTRTNPRAGLFVTGILDIASVLWVLFVPGMWFLLAFGLNGAGELFGVYFPNYVVCCSPKSKIRRNMAFVMLIQTPVAFAPVLFGRIADLWGLRSSFWVAVAILVFVMVLVAVALPARPRPRAEDLEAADLEADRDAVTQTGC